MMRRRVWNVVAGLFVFLIVLFVSALTWALVDGQMDITEYAKLFMPVLTGVGGWFAKAMQPDSGDSS